MAGPDGLLPLGIELTADDLGADAAIENLTVRLRGAQQGLNDVASAAAQATPALDQVGAAANNAGEALNAAARAGFNFQAVNLEEDVSQWIVSLDGVAMSAERAAQSMAVAAEGGASAFRSRLNAVLPEVEQNAERTALSFFQLRTALVGISAIGGVNPMIGQMGAAFASLTGTLGLFSPAILGAGAGIVAAGAEMVAAGKAATDFNQQMTITRNNTTMTDDEFSSMVTNVKNLASATGTATTDLANGFRRAYNETGNATDATKIWTEANQLAVATGSKTEDVTNALATYMHNFGMSANEASQAANALFVSAAQGNMTLQQFSDYSTRATALTGAYGGAAADLGGALSVLTRAFGNASIAQTQYDGLLEHLVSPTSAAQKELARLAQTTGIDLVHDFSQAGLAEKGLDGVMRDLRLALNGNYQELNKLIPGIRGGQAAMVLLKADTGELQLAIDGVSDAMSGKATPAAEAFAREMDQPARKADELHQRLGLLQVSLGGPISQAFGKVLDGLMALGDGFDHAGTFVNQYRDQVSGLVAVLPTPYALLGDLSLALNHANEVMDAGKLAGEALGSVFSDLGSTAHDAWGAINDSSQAHAVGDLFSTIGETIHNVVVPTFDGAKKAAGDAWAAIDNTGAAKVAEGLISEVGNFFDGLGRKMDDARQKAIDAWSAIKQADAVAAASSAQEGPSEAYYQSGAEAHALAQADEDEKAHAAAMAESARATLTNLQSQEADNRITEMHSMYTDMDTATLKKNKEAIEGLLSTAEAKTTDLENQRSHVEKNSLAYNTLTDQINNNKDSSSALQEQLKSLNGVLDERDKTTRKASGASAGDQQAQLNAREATQADSQAIKEQTLSYQTQLHQMQANLHTIEGELIPARDKEKSQLDEDTAAHAKLVNVMAQVRDGQAVNADMIRTYNSAIDENLSRLNDENDETGALRQQLEDAKKSLDNLTGSERDLKLQVEATKSALESEKIAVEAAQEQVKKDQEAITEANKTLSERKQALTDLTSALSAAKSAEQDFANATLPGATAFEDQKSGVTQQINQLQLQMDQIIGSDLAKGMTQSAAEADPALTKLNQQMDVLRNQLDQISLQSSIALDPMTQQIKDLEASGNKLDFGSLIEQLTKAQNSGQSGLSDLIKDLTALNGKGADTLTMQQIVTGITDAQKAQQLLSQAVPGATSAVDTQQAAVDSLTKTLEADQKALQDQQDTLQKDQKAYDKANDTLTNFKNNMQTATDAIGVSNQVLSNDRDVLQQTTEKLTAAKDAERLTADALADKLNPQIDAMKSKLDADQKTLTEVTDYIKEKHILALADNTATLKKELIPAHADLQSQLDTQTTPAVQTFTDTVGSPSKADTATGNSVLLTAAVAGAGGLKANMQDLVSPTTDAANAMAHFADEIERAQSDAAKGVDLEIRIHTTGGGGGVPGHATGTSYSDAGLAVVGEHGPELLDLPAGSRISPITSPGNGGSLSNRPSIVITGNTFVGTDTSILQRIARMIETEQNRLVTLNG